LHNLLHQALEMLFALPTWLSPVIFLPIVRRQMDRGDQGRPWRAWLGTVGVFIAFAAGAWYVYPDGATRPWPTMAAELVLVGPALAVTTFILHETRTSELPLQRRMTIAALAGVGTLLLCLLPAALISSALGGGAMDLDC